MNPNILSLITLYLEDNEQETKNMALETLWENFQPLVISLIRRFCIPMPKQEDTFQDAFIQLLECANGYDLGRGVPFESYYKIHLTYWFLNQSKERLDLVTVDHDWSNGITMSDLIESTIGNAHEVSEINETQAVLQKALQALTLKQRQAVIMYYIHGLPLIEVAKKLGCSYKVAYKHKDVGLKKIRKFWH